MLDGMIIFYSVLFTGCATWREGLYIRFHKIQIERIILLFTTLLFLNIKLTYFENMFPGFIQFKAYESAMLGLIYMLFYNLLIRKIISRNLQEHNNIRVQKRLLYKLPLVGILSGIALNNYSGLLYTNLLFIVYVLLLIVLLVIYFKENINRIFLLLFIIWTVAWFILRIGFSSILYDYFTWIADVFFSLSVFAMLEIYKNEGVKKC